MPKTKRLTDLYVKGKELTIGEGEDAITVWVQKLNPVDQENALRRANAARARFLAKKKDPESFEYQAIRNDLLDKEMDDLIEYLAGDKIAQRSAAIEAEMAAEEEWSDNGYLQGLRDAWNNGLRDKYHTDKEDQEALRVWTELKRFSDSVSERLQGESDAYKLDFGSWSDDKLFDAVFDKMFQASADMQWVHEYRRCELWMGIRDNEKRRERYFEDREEVDLLEQEMLVLLVAAYHEINVDVIEGKDLVGTPPSSPSSEQSEKVEMDNSSGLVGATA